MTKRTAIDLFCGAGGLALGLRMAGFDLRAAVDNDPCSVATYLRNLGPHVIERSVRELTGKELLRLAGLTLGECDLVAGGPPCQGFSMQRAANQARTDPRNDLVLEFLRLVLEVRPRMFLMENVRGLASARGQGLLDDLQSRAAQAGYETTVAKLEAVHFGVPQFRTRIVVVGRRANLGLPPFAIQGAERDATSWRTVREAIADLPSPPADGSPHESVANHFREKRLSAENRERLRHIPPGGGRENLPGHLQLPCHTGNPTHRHLDVYGRLAWDEPSGTITARFDSFTRGRFAHPREDRSITLREGARLQTFPDSFVFVGNREQCASQIGNAVPPLLAAALGRQVLRTLDGAAQSPQLELAGVGRVQVGM